MNFATTWPWTQSLNGDTEKRGIMKEGILEYMVNIDVPSGAVAPPLNTTTTAI